MIMQRQPDGTYAEVEVISDGVDEIDRIVDSNGDVYYQSRIMRLSSLAGAFDATVSGFVNPVWEYNGERQSGNNGKFTILNDNDVVKLRWDGVEEDTNFTVNSAGHAGFNANLKDFRRKITHHLRLDKCSKITGDLSDLGGKITYALHISSCRNVTGTYTPINEYTVPTSIDLSFLGATTSDMDATLNNISITTKKNGTFAADGMTRSSASDEAVEKLVSQGWTISGLTKVGESIADDTGISGIYVQRNPRTLAELVAVGDSSVHPAFMVGGQQVKKLMFGKYQGSVQNNRIYSLKGKDPKTYITLDTYEQYCKNKGDGHHCITAAEWAFLALCAKKDGKMPKGNNNYGKDYSETAYVAIPSMPLDSNGRTRRVATGTGPLTWSDTGDLGGIWDLNGNVAEWVTGIRLVYGELQMIPYNNAADASCDTSATSTEWRAINANATGYDNLFITPNGTGTTTNSVKLDRVSNQWVWKTSISDQKDESRSGTFGATTMSGLSDFCQMYLRAMALAPDGEAAEYESDYFYANNGAEERCARRGGYWSDGAIAGVFHLAFNNPRSFSYASLGSRPAFFEKQ